MNGARSFERYVCRRWAAGVCFKDSIRDNGRYLCHRLSCRNKNWRVAEGLELHPYFLGRLECASVEKCVANPVAWTKEVVHCAKFSA